MNSKALFAIAAFAAIASAAARADEMTISNTPLQSAQYTQGVVNPWWSNGYDQSTAFHSTKTRAEVQAEYLAERDHGAGMNGEAAGSRIAAAPVNSTVDAKSLRAEAAQAVRLGQIAHGEAGQI
ncbi:MAG TPA: hypothetical protein VN649_21250 [Ramlibacter sp.]|nr:hypothetical protein [Ramlibacter sp.]